MDRELEVARVRRSPSKETMESDVKFKSKRKAHTRHRDVARKLFELVVLFAYAAPLLWLLHLSSSSDDGSSLALKAMALVLLVTCLSFGSSVLSISSPYAALLRPLIDQGMTLSSFVLPFSLTAAYLAVRYRNQEHLADSQTEDYLLWNVCLSTALSASSALQFALGVPYRSVLVLVKYAFITMLSVAVLDAGQGIAHYLLALLLLDAITLTCLVGLKKSFTFGEASILSQMLTLYSLDALLIVSFKVSGSVGWLSYYFIHPSGRDEVHAALQGGVCGVLLLAASLSPFFKAYGSGSAHIQSEELSLSASIRFYVAFLLSVGLIVLPLCHILLGTNLFLWVLSFLAQDLVRNLACCLYWLFVLFVSIAYFLLLEEHLRLRKIVARKLYHFLAVVMFTPAVFYARDMLRLSYGVAFAGLVAVECLRVLNVPWLGEALHGYMVSYVDNRDQGPAILSHFYLLLGCALPLWLDVNFPSDSLGPFAGIIAVGIGDAMGAIVGTYIGKWRWFRTGRTLEGSIAMFVSSALFCYYLDGFGSACNAPKCDRATLIAFRLLGILLTTLVEAVTAQMDNLVLPLLMNGFFMLEYVATRKDLTL